MVPVFVALTVLVFVAIDAGLSWKRRRSAAAAPAPTADPPSIHLSPGRFLHASHTWADIRPFGRVRLGVDTMMEALLGDGASIEAPPEGTRVERGSVLFRIHEEDREIKILSPLTGIVQEINTGRASDRPEDWVCSLQPENLGGEIRSFMVADAARDYLAREWRRVTDWLGTRSLGGAVPALPDGGQPARGALSHLDNNDWRKFQHDFLTSSGNEVEYTT